MSKIFKPRILKVVLAIIIVFLMSAGAFIGAAENNAMSAKDESNSLVPANPTAEPTGDDFLEITEVFVGDYNIDPEPIVPEAEPSESSLVEETFADVQPMVDDHGMVSEGIHSDGVISTPGSELDPEVMPGVSENSFSDALNYLSESSSESDADGTGAEDARGPRASLSIVIGTDNDIYDGQGMGRLYKSSSTYYSYDYPYWYFYQSGANYMSRPNAVYDLSDLGQYKGLKITGGKIHYWQYYRYYITGLDVWTMKSIPYETTSASSTVKGWYDEVGGTGSIKMGSAAFTSATDTTRKDGWMTISSAGISELNKRLGNKEYDFAMGGKITKLSSSSTYGYTYWGDVRLELDFTYSAMPDDGRGEIAVGDDLCGYGSSTTKYDYYNYVYFGSSYRGYAAWNSSMIKSLIPQKGPAGETVTLKGIYLRMNTDYYNYANPSVYHMKRDPRDSKNSWSNIYTDAGDGTKYYTHSGAESVPTEMEWDLGEDALDDFNDTLDGNPNFFALGFTSTQYGRAYSVKLVITWKIEYPPMKTLVLGADNPEKAGHSTGYSRLSGSTYSCYSYYYSYLYKSSTLDDHGWNTFDLKDVKAWTGVKVKSAKLILHNQYRYYINGVNFTTVTTTPYHNAPSATAKSVFTESGSSGTQIGSTSFSTSTDTTYHTIEVPLNSAAVTAINTKLGSSSTYYTFGVGMYITALASGYTYGYLRWTDVRLKLTFEYTDELQPTNSGKGVTYGDNWNGHVYKFTGSSDRPYGFMYYSKTSSDEYRAYAQWDISDIKNSFDKVNVSDVIIKKVSVRFNHYSGTSSNISVYQMKSNVTKDTPTNVFTDCGDGTKYYSGSISSSTRNEYEWKLGKDAVKDFQKAFRRNDPDFFGLGFTNQNSTLLYDFSPRLVLEWGFPPPRVTAALTTDPVGIEGTLVYFNANSSLNLSSGTSGLRYTWNFGNDSTTENVTTSPYVQYIWYENGVYPCSLTVNDTNENKEDVLYFDAIIENADPVVDQTSGKISPQPAYEASWVTYSGYRVTDPGTNDTFKYFWDFDGDEIYDASGNCTGKDGKSVPSEKWYYEDDFLGDVSLLIIDDDGGSTNLTTPHKVTAVPQTSATGYVYYYGSKYASSLIYYRWQYTYDYQRGWAKIDISDIPSDAEIQSVIFKGVVSYNYSVNMFGVHLLDSDPVSSTGATVFTEAGLTTNRLFGLTGAVGDKEKDLMPYLNESLIEKYLTQGWVGLGFDYESPTTNGYYYGYMQGYTNSMPSLEIRYETSDPGCLIAVNVKNQPPVVNCENMTVTPTKLNEGEDISVSGISFCDVGNDSYEAQVVVGGIYESEWFPLGGGPIPPGSATDNLALDATASHSGGGSGVWGPDRLNNGDKTGSYNDCWTTGGGWVELDWEKEIVVNSMMVYYTRWRVLPATYCLHTCEVQYWDGTSWQTDQKLDDKSYSTNNDHDIKMTTPRKTSKVRLYNMWAGYNVMIQEWEVFGPGSGNWTPGWGAFGAGCFNVNLTVNMTVFDDHPGTGTSSDKVPITVNVRDDDDHKLIPGTGVGPMDGPVMITSSTTSTGWNGRKVVIDENYYMYAIFVDIKAAPYKIGLGKSTNGGLTWETSTISPDYLYGYQYYPALDIDSNGYLHAVWQMNPYVVYGMSKDQGKTWEIHNVTTSGYVYTPVLAVDEDDNVHVAWNGYLTSYPYKMYYTIRWANGTWGKVTQLTNLFSYYPDIAVDNNGDVHVAWAGYTSSSTVYNIRHTMLWMGNNTWSNIHEVTKGSSYNYYPCMAFDRFNKMHIVWSGQDSVATAPYNIMYTTRTSSGVWGAREYITKITSGNPYQYNPSIAINDAGEMDVIWYGYRSPTWSYPYVVHHAEKTGTSWDVDWNYYTGTDYQYYPRLMYSTFCKAKKGFAFTWFDSYNPFKYFTSDDFEFGDPKFTDGLDFCNHSVTVYNVAPEIDLGATYTIPSVVKEQEEFIFRAEFEDPAAGASTELFEYNITWGDGQYTGWEDVEKFKPGKPAGLTKLVIQPNADDAKDTHIRKQSPYNTYNFATYPYAYVGGYYQISRGLVEFDLKSIPAGYNVTKATMELYFGYRYSLSTEDMRWYPITEGWSEGTGYFEAATGPGVTWDNQPKFNESKPIGSAAWSSGSGTMEFPLDLDMVQGWIDNPKLNFGMISKFEHEANNTGNRGYFYIADYTGQTQGPKLTLEFDRPLPAILPRGVIEYEHFYPDDHPETGTPFDLFDISIDLRDDDLGTDFAETNLTVHDVAPEIKVGDIFLKSSTPWTSGKFGSALMFDGVDNLVDCGNDKSLDITDSITIEAWIMPAVAGETGSFTQGSPISKAESGTTWSWQIRYNAPGGGNYLGFQCNDKTAGSTWVTVNQTLPPNKWYHIAAKFDKSTSTMSMYLNGVQKDSASLSGIKSGTSTLFIGYDGWPDNIFNGVIDEVAIFDRALSTTEINDHMTNGIRGTTGLPTGLAGYWDLDEGTGTIAHDSSANNNHGMIYGSGNVPVEDISSLVKDGVPEGTQITLGGFEFDDVAYDVATERDYGFNYSIDWGDGSPPTEWSDDFSYTGAFGGGSMGGGKLLLVTRGSSVAADEKIFYDWIELMAKKEQWDYDYKQWSTSLDFSRYSVVFLMETTSFYRQHSKLIKSNIIDKGISMYTYGNYAYMLIDQLSLGVDARHGYGGFYYNEVVADYAGITTGFTGRVNCKVQTGGASGRSIERSINFNGADLWAPYSGDTTELILAVWDKDNSQHTYNGVTGDANSGRIDGKVGFYGQTFSGTVTFTAAWNTMMGRCVNWLIEGTGGPGIVKGNVNDSATENNNGRKLVVDKDGNFYTIFRDGTSPAQIYIGNTSNEGETWEINKVSTDSSSSGKSQYEPSLTIDSKGVLHAVWRGDVSGVHQIKYARSTNGGVSWGSFKTVTTGTSSQYAPALAVDSDDTIHIVWHGGSSNIYYTSRTSTGTWGTQTTVASGTHEYPAVAVDSDDNVHVVWAGQTSTISVNNIQYSMLDTSTSTWSTIEMVTTSTTNNNDNPSMVIDLDDNIHIAWHAEPAPTQIQYMKRDAATKTCGGSMEDVGLQTSNPNSNPSIGVDWRGHVYLAWFRSAPHEILMVMHNGKFWSDEVEITPEEYNASTKYPSIMYNGPRNMPGRGTCVVFTAKNGTRVSNLHFVPTRDFNLTDKGPWKGIPSFRHLYPDDNPSSSEDDVYELKVCVRDDDTLIGEWILPLKVYNVWPVVDKSNVDSLVKGPEGKMQTPEIKFEDPGSGPNEVWHVWVDTDNSESQNAGDIVGTLGADIAAELTVKDDRTYGTLKPITLPFNDDYKGTVGVYLYDDDSDSKLQFKKIIYPITGDGEVETIETGTLSSSTAMNAGRNLVMDSKGNLYAVYNDYPTPYKIVCSVSSDVGKTWTQYRVSTESIFNSYYQYYPSVAIDSNDVLHAVWRSQASGYSGYQIAYKNSKDGGKTWGNFKMVPGASSGTNYFYYASIAVDSMDTVHIAAYGYSSSTISTPYNIHYINRTSSGTWSSFTMLTSYTSYRYQYYPSIAVDTKDNVHVAWYGYTPWVTNNNIQYRKMNAITGNWGPLVMITNSSSEYHYYPNIVADLQDNVYIAWSGYPTPYRIKCRRYNATSQVWEATETVFSDGNYNYYPSIGADQAGNMYIAFSGGSPYQIKLTKKTSPTGSWETPILVTDGSQFSYQYYPSILGQGPNCHPLQGTAIVWSGSVGAYNTMFYASEDFWQGEVFERTDYKVIFDIEVENVPPDIDAPPEIYFMPEESVNLPMILSDQGSDDLYLTINWGDGSANESYTYYNNGLTPEPLFPPTHSALNGTAPFEVEKTYTHSYDKPNRYLINVTLTDDDNATSRITIIVETVSPYELKNRAVQLLEGILPGRLDWIGYETLELKYLGKEKVTLLVYNNINRPPYLWETKLYASFCDLDYNDTVFINGTYLDEGMFGTKLILKLYNSTNCLIAENDIDTVYTCLEPIKIGNKYGDFAVVSFTKHKGTTYQFYSNYACKTEDALDHILRSINRDPRRGYGWWHQDWAWWCGYTYYRTLWLDEKRLDPQLGTIVFCEEQQAVLTLMEVLKNCLDPQGVKDITFKNIGDKKIDVEIYTLGDWWFGGWNWFDAAYDLDVGETFVVDGSSLTDGKLTPRIMMRIYDANFGALLDTVYVRTSGEWFLEVEPGNIYGDYMEIADSTLIIGNSTDWDTWWGGDMSWWDWFFGFWYWEDDDFRGCGWYPEDCFDSEEAAKEKAQICGNLSILKQVINMLVQADDILARVAHSDAENMTVANQSYYDEYYYHLKWSKRYHWRGYDNYKKGRPHSAISDFKVAWKYAILASRWALKDSQDEGSMGEDDEFDNPCQDECIETGSCEKPSCNNYPWYVFWYVSYCNWCSFSNCGQNNMNCFNNGQDNCANDDCENSNNNKKDCNCD